MSLKPSYKIVNDWLPSDKYRIKAPYAMTPQYITIHNTWNDASAANEAAYMKRNNNATSYHVAIDDKEARQIIPFSRNAWHAGDGGQGNGNRKSIGIEICYSKSGGPRYAQAEANAIEYVAHVLNDRGWGMDRVKWHRDWSGKNCPHRILDEGRASSVRKRIETRLLELRKGIVQGSDNNVKPMTPIPDKNANNTLGGDLEMTLGPTQKKDMKTLLEKAYKSKVFHVDHTSKVDKMTRGEALDLLISYVARTAK